MSGREDTEIDPKIACHMTRNQLQQLKLILNDCSYLLLLKMIIHIKVVHITHLIQIITGNLRVTIRKVAHQMQIIMLAMAIILRQYILRIVMMEFY